MHLVCTKDALKMKRKKQSPKETSRKRFTITLESAVHALGLQLADRDGRDFSHQIEALIRAEHSRHFKAA